MSYNVMPILLYGWTGSQEHIGTCAKSFGEKHNIDCDVRLLCREIEIDFSNHFQSHIKTKNMRIELSHGDDYCDNEKYYFGIALYYIENVSHKDMQIIQDDIAQAFEKAMEGLEYPEPTFNTVVYWS
jgi:hypothetical protein